MINQALLSQNSKGFGSEGSININLKTKIVEISLVSHSVGFITTRNT
jgi:hypothetical protein